MVVRVVQEDPAGHGQLAVRARSHAGLGDIECTRVAGVRPDSAAPDVAGELVQHDDQRQRAGGGVRPVVELAGAGTVDRRAEAPTDVLVQRWPAAIPHLTAGVGLLRSVHAVTEPELDDFLDLFSAHVKARVCRCSHCVPPAANPSAWRHPARR